MQVVRKERQMPTPFPGVNPYLERLGLWSQVHTSLIIDYHQPPVPPLVREDADWAKTVIG